MSGGSFVQACLTPLIREPARVSVFRKADFRRPPGYAQGISNSDRTTYTATSSPVQEDGGRHDASWDLIARHTCRLNSLVRSFPLASGVLSPGEPRVAEPLSDDDAILHGLAGCGSRAVQARGSIEAIWSRWAMTDRRTGPLHNSSTCFLFLARQPKFENTSKILSVPWPGVSVQNLSGSGLFDTRWQPRAAESQGSSSRRTGSAQRQSTSSVRYADLRGASRPPA